MKVQFLIASLLICVSALGQASTKHWREQLKASEQARLKRDYQKQREILEGVASEAEQLGPISSGLTSAYLAEAYRRLGMDEQAIALINAQLQKIGPNPKDLNLQFARAAMLMIQGYLDYKAQRFDSGLVAAEESKKGFENIFGKFSPELFWSHLLIGDVHSASTNYVEAEKSFKNALKLAEAQNYEVGGAWSGYEEVIASYRMAPPELGILLSAGRLSDLYRRQEKYKEAENYAKKSLRDAETTYGKKGAWVLHPLHDLALAELGLGKRKEFERDCERLAEIASKSKGFDLWVTTPLWKKFQLELDEKKDPSARTTADKIVAVYANQSFAAGALGRRAVAAATSTNGIDWAQLKVTQEVFGSAMISRFQEAPLKVGEFYMEFAKAALNGGPTDVALAAYEGFARTQDTATDKGPLISVLGKIEEIRLAAKEMPQAMQARKMMTAMLREKYGEDSRVADSLEQEAAHLKAAGDEKAASEAIAQANEIRKKALLKN